LSVHFVLRWLMPILVLFAAVFVTSRAAAQVRCVSASAELERRGPTAKPSQQTKKAGAQKARGISRVKHVPLPLAQNTDEELVEEGADGYGVDEGSDASVLAAGWQSPAPPLFPRPIARRTEATPLVPPRLIEVPPPRLR
jgi:hypothetical protein